MASNKFNHNLVKWALLFFAFFPLIPNPLKGLPVILLAGIAFYIFRFKKINLKIFIGCSFLFFLYAFSLIYTSNTDHGLKILETSLSILFIPFSFSLIIPHLQVKKDIQTLFAKLFVLSTTIFSVIGIAAIILDTKTPLYKDYYSDRFRRIIQALPLLGQHPIYASLFLALAIIFTVYLLRNIQKNKPFIILLILSLLINSTFLLMLSSRGVILSLVIIMLIFLLFFAKLTTRFKVILSLIFLASIISMFTFNRRMREFFTVKTFEVVNPNYSTTYRVNILKCSVELIKNNWITGYGVGDVQDQLNQCYTTKSELLLKKTYNSHNQYLDVWLKTGIIGFLYFSFFIFFLIMKSIKNKKFLPLAIILLYSTGFLFENILSRRSGVILFYFLICFFIAFNNKRETTNSK